MGQQLIEGITLTPVKIIENQSGNILHAIKSSEHSFTNFGEAYFSTVKNGVIKGWKKHTKMILNIVVPVGVIRFVCFDDREFSKTKGKFFEVTLSQQNYQRITVEPNIWMAFQGVGEDLNLLLNIASIEHDPLEALTLELGQINYDW